MREFGINGEIAGALFSAFGIFLPGTFLVFFMIRVWDGLKKFRAIRASMEGILAANAGILSSAALILFLPLEQIAINYFIVGATFIICAFTKIPSWVIILFGLLLGIVIS